MPPPARIPFCPYPPAKTVNNALDRGEADTCARKFLGPVQSLERLEQLVSVGHIEADAIVPDKKGRFAVIIGRAELYPCRVLFPRELEGVAKQVLEHQLSPLSP